MKILPSLLAAGPLDVRTRIFSTSTVEEILGPIRKLRMLCEDRSRLSPDHSSKARPVAFQLKRLITQVTIFGKPSESLQAKNSSMPVITTTNYSGGLMKPAFVLFL
jgi:hypothetical protein